MKNWSSHLKFVECSKNMISKAVDIDVDIWEDIALNHTTSRDVDNEKGICLKENQAK